MRKLQGSDIADFTGSGLRMRRSLEDKGDKDSPDRPGACNKVPTACVVEKENAAYEREGIRGKQDGSVLTRLSVFSGRETER